MWVFTAFWFNTCSTQSHSIDRDHVSSRSCFSTLEGHASVVMNSIQEVTRTVKDPTLTELLMTPKNQNIGFPNTHPGGLITKTKQKHFGWELVGHTITGWTCEIESRGHIPAVCLRQGSLSRCRFLDLPLWRLHNISSRRALECLSTNTYWYLLCARHCSRHWGCHRKPYWQDPYFHGANVLVGKREDKQL